VIGTDLMVYHDVDDDNDYALGGSTSVHKELEDM
jgi:hypothetical protein